MAHSSPLSLSPRFSHILAQPACHLTQSVFLTSYGSALKPAFKFLISWVINGIFLPVIFMSYWKEVIKLSQDDCFRCQWSLIFKDWRERGGRTSEGVRERKEKRTHISGHWKTKEFYEACRSINQERVWSVGRWLGVWCLMFNTLILTNAWILYVSKTSLAS